ncbi:MAG: glycerophosphodiester phosphodiesterase family protein [Acholeplasmataceae bacterium]
MKDITWLKEKLIAHRGLHTNDGSVPENSLLAYQKALERGFAIELDVNILKDGTVVCFHDKDLARLTGDRRLLKDVTYDDIRDLRLLDTDERIPTLAEVLELVGGRVNLLIEIKPFGRLRKLIEGVIELLRNYKGVYAIFSFHPYVPYYLKKRYPMVARGQITEYFTTNRKMTRVYKYLMKTMFFNRFSRPDFISYGIRDLPNRYATSARRKGLVVISYAARTQSELDFVRTHYDNVVFEFFEPVIKRAP